MANFVYNNHFQNLVTHFDADNARFVADIDWSHAPNAEEAQEILNAFESDPHFDRRNSGDWSLIDSLPVVLDEDAREYLQSLIATDEDFVDLAELENDPADDAAWEAEIAEQDAQQEVYYAAKGALAHALNAFSIDYIIRAAARHNAAEYPTAANTLDVVAQWLEHARAFKDVDHPDYAL